MRVVWSGAVARAARRERQLPRFGLRLGRNANDQGDEGHNYETRAFHLTAPSGHPTQRGRMSPRFCHSLPLPPRPSRSSWSKKRFVSFGLMSSAARAAPANAESAIKMDATILTVTSFHWGCDDPSESGGPEFLQLTGV
jgi:hypothetical protein